jgi:ABC-type lipoprotein export system ATPase subunit
MADEATGNLDTRSGLEILNILQELNSAGITLVMVTHEREVAEHGDRIILIRDGLLIGAEDVEVKRYASRPPAEVTSGSSVGDGGDVP